MFNPGIFDNGVLIPKLLNNLFASCSFINLAFLFLQTGQIDICNLPFFLLIILASLFLVFFFNSRNQSACLCFIFDIDKKCFKK